MQYNLYSACFKRTHKAMKEVPWYYSTIFRVLKLGRSTIRSMWLMGPLQVKNQDRWAQLSAVLVSRKVNALACFSVKTLADGRGSLFSPPFLTRLFFVVRVVSSLSAAQSVLVSGKLASGWNDGDQDLAERITTELQCSADLLAGKRG